MTLYFENYKGERELVMKGLTTFQGVLTAVSNDLKKRKPNFVSYYKRYWEDDINNLWIDYGSHSEFYIVERK